jgi:hypothetical protein
MAIINSGSSELVREIAVERYVQPAVSSGQKRFSIAVKDIMKDLEPSGFPRSNYPQVCTSLKTQRFLRENSLEIEKVEGPPSGLSTTVVIHYRVTHPLIGSGPESGRVAPQPQNANTSPERVETSAEWAERLVNGISGLLKDELAEYGGGEAFLRWVRSEDDPGDEAFREAARNARSNSRSNA